MKTNIIKKLAAMLTASGLSLTAPLTVTAQNLVVNGTLHPAETGVSYMAVAGTAALYVVNPGASYSGTNINLTATTSNADNGRIGAYVSKQGSLALHSSTVTYTGASPSSFLIRLEGTSTVNLNQMWLSGNGGGVSVTQASVLTGSNLVVRTSKRALEATGDGSRSSYVNVDIITDGEDGFGFYVGDNGSVISATNVVIRTSGYHADAVRIANTGGASMYLTNADVEVSGSIADGFYMATMVSATNKNPQTLVVRSSTITSLQSSALAINRQNVEYFNMDTFNAQGGVYDITFIDSNLSGGANAFNIASFRTGTYSDGTIETRNLDTLVVINLQNTTVTGDALFKGSATSTLNLADNALITGNIIASLETETVVNMADSKIIGDITGSGSSNTNVNLDNSSVTGDVSASGSATLTVSLDNNSTLTGKANSADLSVINNSTWNMTADSQVNNLLINSGGKVIFKNTSGYKTLTVGNLSGSGEFHMNTDIAANTGDLLDITGTSAGAHQVRITNHGNDTAGTEPALLMVRTADGQASFSGTVSVGMFDYSLYKDGSDWYLAASGTNLPPNPPDPDPTDPNPPTPPAPQPGDVGKDILTNTPGGQAPGWFDHNDNIGNHLTDLRTNDRNATVSGRSGGDKDAALTAASILNSVWIKAYGSQLNISGNIAGVGVRELDYGTDIGADRQWNLDKNNTLILGAFAGYGRTDRETRNNFGGESNTDNFRLGLYGIWLNDSGWFADLIAKGQYADSHLNAYDASYNHTTADYDNWGGGISADFGRRFDFEHGWFVEPSVSAAYAHLTGSDYTTGGDNIFSVSTTDADVFQFKVGVAFGRTIKLNNSGVLQPYIKVAGVEQVSTGGKLKASGSEWRPNFDGARAEIGGGIIWQLNADHHLSLDYEASFGDKYDKPWGLTAGYRYQF